MLEKETDWGAPGFMYQTRPELNVGKRVLCLEVVEPMVVKERGPNPKDVRPDVGVLGHRWAREVGGFGLLRSGIGMWLVVWIR